MLFRVMWIASLTPQNRAANRAEPSSAVAQQMRRVDAGLRR